MRKKVPVDTYAYLVAQKRKGLPPTFSVVMRPGAIAAHAAMESLFLVEQDAGRCAYYISIVIG